MSKKPEKTNVMRVLDTLGIKYETHEYDNTTTDGAHVAALLGKDPSCVFKTLVTVGHDRKNYVFVVPVTGSLDLKAAAASVGVKNVEMIAQKQLDFSHFIDKVVPFAESGDLFRSLSDNPDQYIAAAIRI